MPVFQIKAVHFRWVFPLPVSLPIVKKLSEVHVVFGVGAIHHPLAVSNWYYGRH